MSSWIDSRFPITPTRTVEVSGRPARSGTLSKEKAMIKSRHRNSFTLQMALFLPLMAAATMARAEQPPAPCHPNPDAAADAAAVAARGDVAPLPAPLRDQLVRLAERPHSNLPVQARAEADLPSQLFQYYLLDTTGFEPNVFTAIIPGVNDHVQLTATGANCGLPTIGAVRVMLEPKPGLPTDPTNPRAFIDVFTDISGLFVINNESGWYEGWMIHDITVPSVNSTPRKDGHAPDTFEDGEIASLLSIVPGPGPAGKQNSPVVVGDNPSLPRDPDKFDADPGFDNQREFRERGVPSGLANEIFLDVYERLASFMPNEKKLERRLYEAYADEVARVDKTHGGIITAAMGDIDTATDGFPNNERLYLPPTVFNRFAVTREINDGSLAPRFSPSQRAWVLAGKLVKVDPSVPASAGRDADDR